MEMLAEDYFLLMNLTRLLNESITYDTDYHYGAFVPCLEQALKQLGDITGGLSAMVGCMHVEIKKVNTLLNHLELLLVSYPDSLRKYIA